MGNYKKKCRKYKAGDRFCQLYMEEKLNSISYNRPKELLNHKSKVLNIRKHKKNCSLGR